CPLTRGFCEPIFCTICCATGGAMAREAYLIRRGNQFYLRLAIPRPIRSLFPSSTGKPRDFISEPLGRNYDPATVECDRRVADYRALLAGAASMTPHGTGDEIEPVKQRAAGRKAVTDLPMLQSELERVRQEMRASLQDDSQEAKDALLQHRRQSVAHR